MLLSSFCVFDCVIKLLTFWSNLNFLIWSDACDNTTVLVEQVKLCFMQVVVLSKEGMITCWTSLMIFRSSFRVIVLLIGSMKLEKLPWRTKTRFTMSILFFCFCLCLDGPVFTCACTTRLHVRSACMSLSLHLILFMYVFNGTWLVNCRTRLSSGLTSEGYVACSLLLWCNWLFLLLDIEEYRQSSCVDLPCFVFLWAFWISLNRHFCLNEFVALPWKFPFFCFLSYRVHIDHSKLKWYQYI